MPEQASAAAPATAADVMRPPLTRRTRVMVVAHQSPVRPALCARDPATVIPPSFIALFISS